MRLSILVVLSLGCRSPQHPLDGKTVDARSDAASPVTVTATVGSTRFITREHMLAAGEMQISGEPLAQAMGRDLRAYSRDLLPPDLYNDPMLQTFWIDLPGFSTGVESYEYSKQPMNNLAFESGAGTSLVYAPLVNTDSASGPAATAHLAAIVQHYAAGSNARGKWVFAPGTYPSNNPAGNINPNGVGNPDEPTTISTYYAQNHFPPVTISPALSISCGCSRQ
jgi:hypothetical protein